MAETYALARIGMYKGRFGEDVRKFSTEFMELETPMDTGEKFGLYDTKDIPYLIVVAHAVRGKMNSVYRFNTCLLVASDIEEKVTEVADEFQEKTGINLRDAPPGLANELNEIGLRLVFNSFKIFGKRVMAILKERNYKNN